MTTWADEIHDVLDEQEAGDEPVFRRSWQPVDLSEVLDGSWQPPEPTVGRRSDGAGLFYPGKVHTLSSESEGGKKLFSLTGAGRTAAEEGPEAPWEEASRGVDWEALSEIRQAGFGLMEAFGQVWKTGSKDQRDKALAVINEARKKLYLILADED